MKIALFLIFFIGVVMEKANCEPIFQLKSPSVLSMDGSAMNALKIACDDFVANGKDLREFNITISEKSDPHENGSDNMFVVTFMGKLTPGKKGLGSANRVQGSVTYFISRERWKIIKEQGVR